MPKGKADPVEIRFHLQVRKDIARTLTAKRYNEVFRNWLKNGKVPDGFRVPANASEWRNTARSTARGRKWRTGNNRDAIDTLLERSLPAINFKLDNPEQGAKKVPHRGRTRKAKS